MLIEDLIQSKSTTLQLVPYALRSTCSQFLADSASYPLYRSLPVTYSTFHRVKVRAKKQPTSLVNEVMNRAFECDYSKLSQRAIFTHPMPTAVNEQTEPFYVFPINGYKFMYSKEVQNSNNDYTKLIDTLFEQFADGRVVGELATDLLKSSYVNHKLTEGIESNAEIVIYGIPYYYAVRVNDFPSYGKLLNHIQ